MSKSDLGGATPPQFVTHAPPPDTGCHKQEISPFYFYFFIKVSLVGSSPTGGVMCAQGLAEPAHQKLHDRYLSGIRVPGLYYQEIGMVTDCTWRDGDRNFVGSLPAGGLRTPMPKVLAPKETATFKTIAVRDLEIYLEVLEVG